MAKEFEERIAALELSVEAKDDEMAGLKKSLDMERKKIKKLEDEVADLKEQLRIRLDQVNQLRQCLEI